MVHYDRGIRPVWPARLTFGKWASYGIHTLTSINRHMTRFVLAKNS